MTPLRRPIKYYEYMSMEFIVETIRKLNDALQLYIPVVGSKYALCFAFIKKINNLSCKKFGKACAERVFEGDIQDLYEVLTGQKDPPDRMLAKALSKRDLIFTIANEVVPEKSFEDQLLANLSYSRVRYPEIKTKDKYGFGLKTQHALVMRYVEQGKLSALEISTKFGKGFSPYKAFQEVNQKTAYKIEYVKKNGKRVPTVVRKRKKRKNEKD